MAGVRFAALQSRPMAFLDCTSVTLDAFQQAEHAARSHAISDREADEYLVAITRQQ